MPLVMNMPAREYNDNVLQGGVRARFTAINSEKRLRIVAIIGTLHVVFLATGFLGFLFIGYQQVGEQLYLSNIGQIHYLLNSPSRLLIGLHFSGAVAAIAGTYYVYLTVPLMLKSPGMLREKLRHRHRNLGWFTAIAFIVMLIPGAIETVHIFTGHFKYYLLFSGATIVFISIMVVHTGLRDDRLIHGFWSHWLVNTALLQALTTSAIWSSQTLFPAKSQTALYFSVYAISLSALLCMLLGLIYLYRSPDRVPVGGRPLTTGE